MTRSGRIDDERLRRAFTQERPPRRRILRVIATAAG
jgi:hypothetical protein